MVSAHPRHMLEYWSHLNCALFHHALKVNLVLTVTHRNGKGSIRDHAPGAVLSAPSPYVRYVLKLASVAATLTSSLLKGPPY